jgi:hypothetical protein
MITRMAARAVAAASLAAGSIVVYAQDRPAAPPAPVTEGKLTDPAPTLPRGSYVPPNWLSDDQFMRWSYPPGDRPYQDLDGFRIKRQIAEVTAISRKSRDDGNQYWGRIAGTPYDKMTTDWVEAQFKRIGLEQVRQQEFVLPPQWFPTSWELSATAAGSTLSMRTAFPLFNSVATAGAIDLEPIWIGMGTAADFAGRNVTGKAVVVYGFPNPGGRGNTALTLGAVKRADEAGAAAVVMILGFPGNVMNEPQAGGTAAPAKIPVFMVGDQDGTAIRQMIERQQSPRLRLRLAVEMRTGLKTANVWGVLPGATDENVAVMAHTDAFFEGAMDNASGMATLVALAEHYAKLPKAQRRRTMTFFTTSAHHSPSGEDAGISWIHNNMKEMFSRTALLVNCEHTAQVATYLVGEAFITSNLVSARRWFVGGSALLKNIVLKTFNEYGIALYSRPEGRPGGELGEVFTDAPSFHIIDHTVYHTDIDTLSAVPAYGLEQSARAFARIIDEANKLEIAALRGGPVTTTR